MVVDPVTTNLVAAALVLAPGCAQYIGGHHSPNASNSAAVHCLAMVGARSAGRGRFRPLLPQVIVFPQLRQPSFPRTTSILIPSGRIHTCQEISTIHVGNSRWPDPRSCRTRQAVLDGELDQCPKLGDAELLSSLTLWCRELDDHLLSAVSLCRHGDGMVLSSSRSEREDGRITQT